MSQSAPVMGGFYRLKAGSLCQVREIAKAADSGEEMVVYQLLSGNFTTYVCPLREFNFEPASIGEEESAAVPYSRSVSASRELSMQELMISFFDEDNFEKKEDILTEIGQRADLNDSVIDNMAAALDVVIDEGPLDDRISSLRKCVRTRARFENTRLRG